MNNDIKKILKIIKSMEEYYNKKFLNTQIIINNCNLKDNQTSVTEFDIDITDYCIKKINENFENSNIIIEEDNSTNSNNFNDLTWIIDPLDGTASFIRSYPVWGIGIAVLYKKEPIVSYFYTPLANQKFLAYGDKIFVNNKDMQSNQAILTDDTKTIFISSKLHEKISFDDLKGYKLRNFGSTIYHIFLVSIGKAESCIIGSCYLWDIAAVFYLANQNNYSFYEYKTDKIITLDELLKYSSNKIDKILQFKKVSSANE